MKPEQAEEFTEALGQVLGGAVRLAEWAPQVGIPEALGLTAEEWAQRKLTGRVKLSIEERRRVVEANPDPSTRELGEALGVDQKTIVNDRREIKGEEFSSPPSDEAEENSSPTQEGRRLGFMMSSASDEWETPQDLYDTIAAEFDPQLDVCALPASAKCDRYFTPDDDGLSQDWAGVCWMNPPYGGEIGRWVEKAHQAAGHGATVVCLVPARVETNWWWDHCRYGEVRFLRGRLRFGGSDSGAPFPSALVIFKPDAQARVLWWERPQ